MPTTDALDSRLLELAQALIRSPSVTPDDAGCQQLIGSRLASLGFRVESMRHGAVDNLWATLGDSGPLLVFAGHTDVVPTGPEEEWSHPPFAAVIEQDVLHGRGAADMKGSLASMIAGVETVLGESGPPGRGRIGFLITSDEEGPAEDGTRRVMDTLGARGERIDYCVVGEPSSSQRTGDVIRVGRRGSLNARLRVRGIQGHVAYPDQAANPIHRALAALDALASRRWDDGNDHFPPTSLQITNIHAGTGATNVIPGNLEVLLNIRFCTEQTDAGLREAVTDVLEAHDLDFELHWQLSGEPFLTAGGALVDAVVDALHAELGIRAELSTGGGTSDGRFIAPSGAQVVELGPCNRTIHQIDEQVSIRELCDLRRVHAGIIRRLLA